MAGQVTLIGSQSTVTTVTGATEAVVTITGHSA